MVTIAQAKVRLDMIIAKGRVDLYKPIQIEVLRHSRLEDDIDVRDIESYRNQSVHWRDESTDRLVSALLLPHVIIVRRAERYSAKH